MRNSKICVQVRVAGMYWSDLSCKNMFCPVKRCVNAQKRWYGNQFMCESMLGCEGVVFMTWWWIPVLEAPRSSTNMVSNNRVTLPPQSLTWTTCWCVGNKHGRTSGGQHRWGLLSEVDMAQKWLQAKFAFIPCQPFWGHCCNIFALHGIQKKERFSFPFILKGCRLLVVPSSHNGRCAKVCWHYWSWTISLFLIIGTGCISSQVLFCSD